MITLFSLYFVCICTLYLKGRREQKVSMSPLEEELLNTKVSLVTQVANQPLPWQGIMPMATGDL